jgi:hypothetical protein
MILVVVCPFDGHELGITVGDDAAQASNMSIEVVRSLAIFYASS